MQARGIGQTRPQAPTREQCLQAQDVLGRASAFLHLYHPDLASQRLELVQRFGEPADEVVKVAREHEVDCIVIGSRGNSSIQNLRRLFAGSTSREIMRLAPCPVVLVTPPQNPVLLNLVAWYEEAITHYLHEQLDGLTILTPEEVTRRFVPPSPTSPTQRKKLTAAASIALEQLARRGLLCCQKVNGELRCLND
jgi:hypothetical protein